MRYRRTYANRAMQLTYDSMRRNPPRHASGQRRAGALWGAFWRGVENRRLSGNRVPYPRGSIAWAAYFAGRDANIYDNVR